MHQPNLFSGTSTKNFDIAWTTCTRQAVAATTRTQHLKCVKGFFVGVLVFEFEISSVCLGASYFKTRAKLAKTNRTGFALAPEKTALPNAAAVGVVGLLLG